MEVSGCNIAEGDEVLLNVEGVLLSHLNVRGKLRPDKILDLFFVSHVLNLFSCCVLVQVVSWDPLLATELLVALTECALESDGEGCCFLFSVGPVGHHKELIPANDLWAEHQEEYDLSNSLQHLSCEAEICVFIAFLGRELDF